MSCPYKHSEENGVEAEQEEGNVQLTYHSYLQLEKILGAQEMKSEKEGETIHDEHLFITIHQSYELWFQQLIYDVNCARSVFKQKEDVDAGKLMDIVKRMQRAVLILKMCNDKIDILETMTPWDFLQFRGYLFPASGFQSWQFRILENLLGVGEERRIKYSGGSYKQAFSTQPKNTKKIEDAEKDISLFQLLDGWLQYTLDKQKSQFDFHEEYKATIENILKKQNEEAQAESDESRQEDLKKEYKKRKEMFDSILDRKVYDEFLEKGEWRLSHKGLLGALMILLYREEPAFNLANQMLHLLMDIDSLMAKWRYNHMMLVQRMIGSRQSGTVGSSGYQYLRSTVSGEKYKVFLDIFNLSAFLLPKDSIPKFTRSS